jgi:hypothetical protein
MSVLSLQGATRVAAPAPHCASPARSGTSLSRSVARAVARLSLHPDLPGQLARARRHPVVSPHPDDDVITAAGVMLRARQNGETVRSCS